MDRQREWELSDWERLGREFAAAREAAGLTQIEAGMRIDVSRGPIQGIERGRQSNGQPFTRVTRTMHDYAALVGWTKQSPNRILDGQEPEPATPPVPKSADPKSDLPPAVERELRSGKTLDHAVVHLGEDEEDDTRLIVVLQGADDMTEEEIDRAWHKWRRTRRQLQARPSDSDIPQEP